MAHNIPSYYRYVSSLTIAAAGSGYDDLTPPTITITGGGGAGATAVCTVSAGEIDTVTVTNIGTGYTSSPDVALSGPVLGGELTANLSFASGSSTEYDNTLKDKIKYSVPEFVREEYSTFMQFLEKYYEWMEEEGNPIHILINTNYNNIDTTGDAELDKWATQLAANWSKNVAVDRTSLYKNIKYIYETKGSRNSIETFFRIFFNEEVDILYPSQYVIRASDGRWQEPTSVKAVSANKLLITEGAFTGDIDVAANHEAVLGLTGKIIDITYFYTTGFVTVSKTIPATVSDVLAIAYSSPQEYEIFIDIEDNTTIIPGPGSNAGGAIVFEGPIATVDNVGAPHVSRQAGIYPTAVNYTTNATGSTAEFQITVDGAGAASVVITDDGVGFVVDEIITVPDSVLGGGGAPDLTFDVETLLDGELGINDITISNTGLEYTAAPILQFFGANTTPASAIVKVTETGSLDDVVILDPGSGYTQATAEFIFDTDPVRTFITLRADQNIDANAKAYLDRCLLSASAGVYSGSETNAGFQIGQILLVNENGDDAIGYAFDYFAEDYVIIGGANKAYVRVERLDANGVPDLWTVIDSGHSFVNATTNISLYSVTGEEIIVPIFTGYLFQYEGQYADDRGKLSNVNRLQDNAKYQSYSYIIKSSFPQSVWDTNLRGTVHPAGWEVFGELRILNELTYSMNIIEEISSININTIQTDLAVTSETGVALVQNYIDSEYYGEDYFGTNYIL
jgi:hypothetical protein